MEPGCGQLDHGDMHPSLDSCFGHAALRRGRVSLPGQIYLVTFTTQTRKPVFSDLDLAGIASRALTDRRAWTHSRLLAWVLMPDHWHGLVELGETEQLHALVGRLKTNSARCLRAEAEVLDGVWARAFHDRALRHGDELIAAARYVVMNPVRAGLVTNVANYPYWNAIWL